MRLTEFCLWVLFILGGFSMGSILFCKWIPLVFLKTDICLNSDDHNPGASNVFSQCGIGWGMLCLALDLAKGFIPVFLAIQFLDPHRLFFGLVLAAPVLGHAIAPFNHFHGGKCIATAFGTMLGLLPIHKIGMFLAAFYIFFSTFIKVQPNRIRSIVVFGLFGIVSTSVLLYQHLPSIGLGCFLISVTAILKHSSYFAERTRVRFSEKKDQISFL